jgi:outer membrane murein-binding lipoprotein Lpp
MRGLYPQALNSRRQTPHPSRTRFARPCHPLPQGDDPLLDGPAPRSQGTQRGNLSGGTTVADEPKKPSPVSAEPDGGWPWSKKESSDAVSVSAAAALRAGAGSPLAQPRSVLDILVESAAVGMASKLKADQEKAMGETLHQTLERVDGESSAPPPPPPSDPSRSEPEPPSSAKAGDHEHHPTTKTLDYLALGIILAPAPEVIAMYLRHEDIDLKRVVISFVVSTTIGSAILWFAHGWHKTAGGLATFKGRINRADDYFVVRAAIIAFFMIVPVLIAPLISGVPVQPSPIQPGFTQQQVDAKIASAVANLNAQLTEANRQRDAARREAEAFREQIQNAPAPVRELDTPRVFTKLTPAQIGAIYDGRTPLQGDILFAEGGKWLETDGKVENVVPGGIFLRRDDGQQIICTFDNTWRAKLSVLRLNDVIKVIGKLHSSQNKNSIGLTSCEFSG